MVVYDSDLGHLVDLAYLVSDVAVFYYMRLLDCFTLLSSRTSVYSEVLGSCLILFKSYRNLCSNSKLDTI